MNFLDRLFTFFQNKTLNALGVERDIMELIKAKDISLDNVMSYVFLTCHHIDKCPFCKRASHFPLRFYLRVLKSIECSLEA